VLTLKNAEVLKKRRARRARAESGRKGQAGRAGGLFKNLVRLPKSII
jgi:hypothetical protein